ncbi:hypothetical protein ACELLULO517_12190 [Acidisoma cellulosilytica]|uniref:Uncharacterized protein n=1 Tax=Acidisoma cellulosilyticum TaxID=2802395 RepID=A0A964E419_9PROT|nr:hypothetical protein [Acidisoma cellulosilyticum]MCB8880996.1 hypothetical protein [Acidisoma cellulosilyticum]
MAEVSYTRETLIKDLINTISLADGKGIHLGYGTPEEGADRDYILDVATVAIEVVNALRIKTA